MLEHVTCAVKGGPNNDSGIGVLVDNRIALCLIGSAVLDLLPMLHEECIRLRYEVGIQGGADK
jgi:hypothetical protein